MKYLIYLFYGLFSLVLMSACSNADRQAETIARNNLLEVIRQDKSGQDVDNDSLLRPAFTWFQTHEDDTLYARCMYYMGKYYMLNDSTDQATSCFTKAIERALQEKDTATVCLVMDKQAKVIRLLDPNKGLTIAKEANRLYNLYSLATETNKIYHLLNISTSEYFNGQTDSAVVHGVTACERAALSGDSIVMADAYQNLSNCYREAGNNLLAVQFAEKSYQAAPSKSNIFALAMAYLSSDNPNLASSILDSLHSPLSNVEQYTYYYMLHQISMKRKQYDKAEEYVDSTFFVIEQMYGEQLSSNSDYYKSAIEKEKQIIDKENTATLRLIVFVSIFLLCGFVCISLFLHYRMKSKHNLEIKEKEITLQNRLHQEELRNRDVQIDIMRSYLIKKIDITEKIESLREKSGNHIVLTETEWKEIEVFLNSSDNFFVNRIKEQFPLLNEKDLHLMMLLRLHLPQKAIASIYGVSEKAIKQKLFLYKEKVGIEGEKQSLRDFVQSF